jgi:hypothetical protein
VFKNRVLRRMLGPKREEVVGGWRRLHNEELYKLYASPNAGNFSLHHCVQNGSGAYPASYPMSTRGSFPGIKLPEREADHTPI